MLGIRGIHCQELKPKSKSLSVSHYTFAKGYFSGQISHGLQLGGNQRKWLNFQFESAK